jgi:hypothetical protein
MALFCCVSLEQRRKQFSCIASFYGVPDAWEHGLFFIYDVIGKRQHVDIPVEELAESVRLANEYIMSNPLPGVVPIETT